MARQTKPDDISIDNTKAVLQPMAVALVMGEVTEFADEAVPLVNILLPTDISRTLMSSPPTKGCRESWDLL